MGEIIRQAVYNCRSVYNLIHGPEFWLVFPFLMGTCFASAIIGFWVFDKWEDDNDN